MASFPRVRARNLEGVSLTLPDDLEGDLSCVVVAFQQQHQRLVDTWLPHLEVIAQSNAEFRYYEMPTIGRRWLPARRFIDGGMARAIADQAARERTVTVYADAAPIVDALGLDGTNTITTVLVDRRGEIRWQATGAFSEAARAELERVVREARST